MATNQAAVSIAIGEALPERFPFIKPTLPPLDAVLAHYAPAYASGMVTNSSVVRKFEAAVAERLGVAHAVAVASCTSGLMLTLRALGISGEVILPSFTFFATGHAAVWNGLRPVFADCEPETWTLDAADVERRITEKTAAIVGVHMYGNPCDIDALSAVAERHRLPLVFDAAHAFGSYYRDRPIGQFGAAEVFSLTPTKLLVAGEGGIVTTNDGCLAQRLRAGRNYGDAGNYDPESVGLNARMGEFNAALALAGLELVDRKVARHNEIARQYSEVLSATPRVRFQTVRQGCVSSYKDFSILLPADGAGISRDDLGAALFSRNIETRKYFYPPLHRQKMYQDYFEKGNDVLPNTELVSESVLSLPIYESLSDATVKHVALTIRNLLGQAG